MIGKVIDGGSTGKRVLLGGGGSKKGVKGWGSEQAVSSGLRLGRHSISSFLIVEL